MTLQGAGGAFPDVARARTLWVGVDRGAQRLAGLAEAVDRATVDAGFAPADKAFRPHLTIGRARERSAGAGISRIISENADIYLGAVDVKAIHICSSKLTPSGPIYTSLAEILLSDDRTYVRLCVNVVCSRWAVPPALLREKCRTSLDRVAPYTGGAQVK